MSSRSFCVVSAALLVAACSFDWDTYDPRLGDGPDAGSDASSGGSGGVAGSGVGGTGGSQTGGSSGTGGSGAAGGSGGSAGAGGGSGGVAGMAAGGSAGSGGAAGAGGATMTITYSPPEVSDCISLTTPDPDACATASGPGVISIDAMNGALASTPSAAFLSFDIDSTLAGKQILSVALELQATTDVDAASTNSGEVWEVAPFTRPDLFNGAPAKVGSSPLAPDPGGVASLQIVSWALPTSAVKPGQMAYFGIYTTANDGADYYSKVSPAPPKLVVTYQ